MPTRNYGGSDPTLDAMASEARSVPANLAAKISGSGLGDCVLALGAVPDRFDPVPLAVEGARLENSVAAAHAR